MLLFNYTIDDFLLINKIIHDSLIASFVVCGIYIIYFLSLLYASLKLVRGLKNVSSDEVEDPEQYFKIANLLEKLQQLEAVPNFDGHWCDLPVRTKHKLRCYWRCYFTCSCDNKFISFHLCLFALRIN